ncbi:MAG: alpha/beta hydrolase [Chloroflexi bacterium]|nr:MAG: alpha/beta hydrolase [Chloroflexota bacterium]
MQHLARDGVRLAYTESGSGSPPLLLVHGWTCDHTYFAPQAEHFSRSHRVVSVDLRGHGASDKPEQEYTMAAFADDLRWMCEQLGVERPVVVGHSMGGVIAFEMAARYPDIVGAVVAVDSPIVPPDALAAQIPGLVEGLKSPAYRDVSRGFVSGGLFLPTDDPERKARIVEAMAAAPQHVMASAMECIFTCDTSAAVASCKAPALLINAAVPLADLARLQQLCPHIMIGQTVGAGHFNQLEVPDQVNAMIERFLAVAL